ncbi:MAG: GNAT family N-acetyltransferase [Isosphaeraceae bacterium]
MKSSFVVFLAVRNMSGVAEQEGRRAGQEQPGAAREPTESDAVEIRGERLLLRAFRAAEIDEEWLERRDAHPMTVAMKPDEREFRERLSRSGRLEGASLTLSIDRGGESIGRIETYLPPGRPLPPGVYEVGIGVHESMRGKGYGPEALALLTRWLFEHAGAKRVQASTDPANLAMRTVFDRVGWREVGPLHEFDREWVMYAITEEQWRATNGRRSGGAA